MPALAGFDVSVWSIFLVFFLVGPVLGWGRRSRSYWGRRWGRWDWEGARDSRGARLGYEALAAELGERNAVIEQLEARVAELENRLDFAERMLAAHRPSPAELSPPPVGQASSSRSLT